MEEKRRMNEEGKTSFKRSYFVTQDTTFQEFLFNRRYPWQITPSFAKTTSARLSCSESSLFCFFLSRSFATLFICFINISRYDLHWRFKEQFYSTVWPSLIIHIFASFKLSVKMPAQWSEAWKAFVVWVVLKEHLNLPQQVLFDLCWYQRATSW